LEAEIIVTTFGGTPASAQYLQYVKFNQYLDLVGACIDLQICTSG
jgi:hypothetical protein